MNAEWHRQNVMPKNATEAQRVAWHSEHAKFCACRPIPPTVKRLIDRAAAADGPALRPAQIRQLLSGGDRRDIAQSGRVRAAVERNPNDPTSWGKVGRNEACPCGSGKKYKHCHGRFA